MMQTNSSQLIDYDVIRGYAPDGSEKEILRELGAYFENGVPKRLEEARKSAGAKDFKLLCEHLHALKNSFLNVGARGVAEVCQDLENEVRMISEEEITTRLDGLQDQYRSVCKEITGLLNRH